MAFPKFSCLCCTFLRPKQLANAVACFEALDYPLDRRELIALDDVGQYPDEPSGPGWQIVSIPRRFQTLGEKRNALAGLASSNTDAFVVWDDDDAYLPWTLSAHASVLSEGKEWSAPSVVFNENQASPRLTYHKAKNLFHAAWAFSRDAFRAVHGYPWKNSGEDQALGGRLARSGVKAGDPTELWPPYFIHRWVTSGSWHLSAHGSSGYDRLAERIASDSASVSDWSPRLSEEWGEIALSHLRDKLATDCDDAQQLWSSQRQDVFAGLQLKA